MSNVLPLPGMGVAPTEPDPCPSARRRYAFFVAGEPRPMGSKSAFGFNRKDGSIGTVVTDAVNKNPRGKAKLRSWKDSVSAAAMVSLGHDDRIVVAVSLTMVFHLARLGGHYGKRGLLPSAPAWPITAFDLDKLSRATQDALAVVMLANDSRVVRLALEKRYADHGPTGAQIVVEEVAPS